jgi:DNA invertase Pin-like site-specific DNA recombinase
MSATISEQHRAKPAYVYVRQSTMGQVRFHQESTERQYALRDKAQALGWADHNIRTLDGDLGVSGAHTTGREDFKTLIADVTMGQVGAVFALEASRLARSNLEWHRLIELCGLTHTLVIDADGCYDPGDFNDGLLLGLKATMAQAELHFLRARLQGGKLNKANKGLLRSPLPVGLCYDDDNAIVLDPDQEVQGAVRMIFRLFAETGSAYAVVHRFAELKLHFPKRAYGGAWAGKIIWGRLNVSRVLGVLKNPQYAGAYVYGRYQTERRVGSDGQVHSRTRAMPIEQWRVNLKDHHLGYISWDEYLSNAQRLERNRTNSEATVLSGPAREGLALLHGLLLCGVCGHKLSVRYRGNGGIRPAYECNWRRRDALATKSCITVRCEPLDEAVVEQVLACLTPVNLELATQALEQLQSRDQLLTRQWQMRLERADYETQLAQRRYEEVDPSNRLVAATLERRWNEALERFQKLELECAESQRQHALVATPEQRQQVLALAKDFPKLWQAPTTAAKDRKRMLRLLIEDITVERPEGQKRAVLHLRWRGGACTDLDVQLPANIADIMRYPPEMVEHVRDLAKTFRDQQIASQFNAQGRRSSTGKTFTASMIQWIRHRHHIPPVQLKEPDEFTVKQLAERFGVSSGVVYYWIARGVISARQLKPNTPYWIKIDATKELELRNWVHNSWRISGPHDPQPEL